ncbi:hypothetical protein QTP70_029849 [Hemibagrus guttatus]|uniref:DUF4939 domain-containing protein n=1 Tax=Hemibagrus guttatus TaxID=175788 RepID=A0AAE0QLI4_9TELE|nr:hypothetical protein QTP70_029849 [Hemibagrus guttatus]KAK3555888.1 hypothetical protein QTP86_029802 [Hemibagrus guttatus]
MLPHQFSGDRAKIAFIISLLSGKARRWAESMWTTESPVMQFLDLFLVHFKDVFGTSTSALSVHDELFSLWQADRAIHDYTLHFRTLAASSGWNEAQHISQCLFVVSIEEGTPSDTSSSCSSPAPEPMPNPNPNPLRTPETALLGSTTIESPVSSTQANLPGEYQDYQDVFSQMAATKLPPHRPWDCAIDLLPGAKLPKGRVYPLSIPSRP